MHYISFIASASVISRLVNNFVYCGNIHQINQLEKDEDVVAQAQAIAALEALPQLSFSVVNALNNFLSDSKVFYLCSVGWLVAILILFTL